MSLFDFFRGNNGSKLMPANSGASMPKFSRIGGGGNLGRGFGTATGALAAADADRLTAGWTTTPVSPYFLVEHCWQPVCARGREAARNKPHAKKFLRLCTTNVIGHKGMQISPAVSYNGKADTLAREALKSAFADWGKDPEVTGLYSWHDLEKLVMRTVATDGEIFIRKLRGKGFGKYRYQLQAIDPTRVPVNLKKELSNGNRIFAGIEYTPYGRPVAYYVVNEDPHYMHGVTSYQEATRVPAEDMIHLFAAEMIGQKRGFSWLAGSLPQMHHLDKYTEASIVNARVGASKQGFFELDPDKVDLPDEDDDAEDIPMDAEPGTFDVLPVGYKFAEWSPQFPQGEYQQFITTNLHIIAADLGVSYASLSGDLSQVNFSSIRAGVLPEQDFWMDVQEWLKDRFYSVVYRDWVEQAVLHKTIRIGATPLKLERIDQYEQAKYNGRRWKYVDPIKEVNAERLQHKGMLKSISQTIRERGDEPEEVFKEIAEDIERVAKEIGVSSEAAATLLGFVVNKGKPNDNTSQTNKS